MTETNVFQLAQPGTFTDSLTEVLRSGTRALLTRAVEAEVAEFLAQYADLKTEDGRQRLVCHGHLPEREIMTGIGAVAVRQRVCVIARPSLVLAGVFGSPRPSCRPMRAGRRASRC